MTIAEISAIFRKRGYAIPPQFHSCFYGVDLNEEEVARIADAYGTWVETPDATVGCVKMLSQVRVDLTGTAMPRAHRNRGRRN